MCDSDAEGPQVGSSRWRRARISHQCDACAARWGPGQHDTIGRGDLYWSADGLWDGTWGRVKHCAPCHAVYDFLCAATTAPVDLDLNCGETWPDAEDAAQALAFWSHADGQSYAAWAKHTDGRRHA